MLTHKEIDITVDDTLSRKVYNKPVFGDARDLAFGLKL